MHLKTFRIRNFRRLRDVRIDLDTATTIFVGANNSGKTAATHVFRTFLRKSPFRIYDFSASTWQLFDEFDVEAGDPDAELPRITLDLWFEVEDANLQRVINLLPSLDWNNEPVGLRIEYAPVDGRELVGRYQQVLNERPPDPDVPTASWQPWPQSLTDYLSKRLTDEYELRYLVLDAKSCDEEFRFPSDYEPLRLPTGQSGARLVDSLIRVDFLDAQRHLTDTEAHGRAEELSKRLARFYERNLEQHDQDVAALSAVAETEARLNAHFAEVFEPTLERLQRLGYPGFADPELVVRTALDGQTVLNSSAQVFYKLSEGLKGGEGARVLLPDQYNGLGFKNLIYMVVEVLDSHFAWHAADDVLPPVHLVMIEEPESHLHAQLQQVFIRKIREVLPESEEGLETQMVVTTHSAHVLYESSFQHIRYFRRSVPPADTRESDVRNLSLFYDREEAPTRRFLLQYMKLTHGDLFFADGAVLVEGNVERLLVPLIIEKDVRELRSRRLAIIEVGGAHAHRFKQLIEFLDLPTLLIADLDSVIPNEQTGQSRSCMTTEADATTANPILKDWLPQVELIAELLTLDATRKISMAESNGGGQVRVAYQTTETADWSGESKMLAGRTFEEAFALQNLNWIQSSNQVALGLGVKDAAQKTLDDLHEAIYNKVRTFDKTAFALALIDADENAWVAPAYIVEGLEWMRGVLVDPTSGSEDDGQPDAAVTA
ncbi:MAG TPA: ATP-dependent endonuclease [Thermoleophilaceae bacterium]|jgi:predicted ATP-dependent endonuclease of OLD family